MTTTEVFDHNIDDSYENQLAYRHRKKLTILTTTTNTTTAALVIFVILLIISAATANSPGIPTQSDTTFKLSLSAASRSLSNASSFLTTLQTPAADKILHTAITNCKLLLDDAIYQLKHSHADPHHTYTKMNSIMSSLSAALANQRECLESFEQTHGALRRKASAAISSSKEHTTNTLAIAAAIMQANNKKTSNYNKGHPPNWASTMQNKFLYGLDDMNINWTPNVTVAKDGTGMVSSINEALNMVTNEGINPFFIYVKEGIYEEYVVVEKLKWNVYMIGDGLDKTIVTGNRNAVDSRGIATRDTATFSVFGQGFVAKGIGFHNTAGPHKAQAVALFSNSDQSIFYRCSFNAYQDTLYAHSNRQFYRECDIIGTIDFIFGDSAAVFQKCNILPREPLSYQHNVITAHGKELQIENTGFSIHNCFIGSYDVVTRPTYLGRPWKSYSTAVFMKTEIGAIVDPAGWETWNGSLPPDTIKFAEFENTGLGANTSGRVSWAGCWSAISEAEAEKYTVAAFVDGDEWIPISGVPFEPFL